MIARPSLLEELRGAGGTFRPGPRSSDAEQVAAGHRARLIAAMAEAVAEHGYGPVTVAEVVRRSRVSRRTFCQHFADKEACLLATYDSCSNLLMARIAQGVGVAEGSWEDWVSAGVALYLETMAEEPGLARVFIIDILSLGDDALARRLAVHRRCVELVIDLAALHAGEVPGADELDPQLVVAVIGAVNEPMLNSLAGGGRAELRAAQDTTRRLVRAMILAALPAVRTS